MPATKVFESPIVQIGAFAVSVACLAVVFHPEILNAARPHEPPLGGDFVGFQLIVWSIGAIGMAALWPARRSAALRPAAIFFVVVWTVSFVFSLAWFVFALLRLPFPMWTGLALRAVPQYASFGEMLRSDGGYIVPEPWQGIVTAGVWTLFALAFGRFTGRDATTRSMLGLAAALVALVVALVFAAVELFGLRIEP